MSEKFDEAAQAAAEVTETSELPLEATGLAEQVQEEAPAATTPLPSLAAEPVAAVASADATASAMASPLPGVTAPGFGAAPTVTAPAVAAAAPAVAAAPGPYQPQFWAGPAPVKTGPRVGVIVWGFIIIAMAVWIIAVASGFMIDGQLALIIILAGAGAALILSALIAATRRNRT
ncbi:MAG: hypothetical protein LBR27_04855 [Bifidobacteriaceae bacterium]|jgi:hypothetical protein|nr:hypothetical protein [Bifidobacteriaceae bacterium]